MFSFRNASQLNTTLIQSFLLEQFGEIRESAVVNTFISVISKMITTTTTLLSDYKFTLLMSISVCAIVLSVFGLHANEFHSSQEHSLPTDLTASPKKSAQSNNTSEARMKVLQILGKDQYILKFVSHPKVIKYFQEQWLKADEEHIKVAHLLEDLVKQFPSDNHIKFQRNFYRDLVHRINSPIHSQEIIFPFLFCGVGNFEAIESVDLKKIQRFQVALFKCYISRVVFECWGGETEDDLIKFCKKTPNSLFFNTIGPFLKQLHKKDLDISDIFSAYDQDEEQEKFSSKQRKILKELFDAYESSSNNEIDVSDDAYSDSENDLLESLGEKYLPEEENIKNSNSIENPSRSPAAEALQDVYEKNNSNRFSKERLIELYFDVLIEEFPEKSQYFADILKKGTLKGKSS